MRPPRHAAPRLFRLSYVVSLLLAVPSLLGYSLQALSQSDQCAVYSGAEVAWNGSIANTNQPFVHNGNGLVNNSYTYITGASIVTKTTGGVNKTNNFAFSTAAGDTGGAQTASYAAYYMYYGQYIGDGGITHYSIVVSTFSPAPEGDPSANISYTAPDTTPVPANINAVFLGSYITDADAGMVPFTRAGNEVLLSINHAITGSTGQLCQVVATGCGPASTAYSKFSWTHALAPYPVTQNASIGSLWSGTANVSTWPIPKSNAGGIVSVIASTVNGGGAPSLVGLGIFDKRLTPVAGAGTTTWYPEIDWSLDNNVVGGLQAQPPNNAWLPVRYTDMVRVPVDSNGNIYVADAVDPDPPNGANGFHDDMTIYYRGYIEVIHHLGN